MKSQRVSNLLLGWMCLLALLMVGMAIIGGVKNYSPIPFWDMWSGVAGFILAIQDGDYAQWWGQHNEHRIVVSRILFWMDYAFFGFKAISLFVWNYVFAALAAWTFVRFIASIAKENDAGKDVARFLSVFIVAWLFLWTQRENFTWAFQSQFFLAQLLPLVMFYLLAVASASGSARYFALACAMGVLAAGSMANGVVALPLAFVLSCFLPFTRSQRIGLLVLAIIVPLIYFWGFVQPVGHGSLSKTLMSDPLGVLRYTMIYIGSPFYAMAQKSRHALLIAEVLGGVLILASLIAAMAWLLSRKRSPYVGGLLFFILFVGGTAVGTAGGRLLFGLHQATAERYTTPAVMAWAAIFIIIFSYLKRWTPLLPKVLGAVLLFLSLVLLTFQTKALRPNYAVNFDRSIGALASTLRVADPRYFQQLYFDVDYSLAIQQKLAHRNLGFTTMFPYAGIAQSIGSRLSNMPQTVCEGGIDEVIALSSGNGYDRVTGWILDSQTKHVPEKLAVVDEQDVVVGYVLTGNPLAQLPAQFDSRAKRPGFVGYVKSAAQGHGVRLVAADGSCSMSGALPKLVFQRVEDPKRYAPSLFTSAIVSAVGFNGAGNIPPESAPGATIRSSYVTGDADVGTIKLRVKNGDVLMYQTGPVAAHQRLKSSVADVQLPLSTQWSMLRFLGFPDDDLHEVSIEDAGNAWGEWSAIALRNQ